MNEGRIINPFCSDNLYRPCMGYLSVLVKKTKNKNNIIMQMKKEAT